MNLISHAKGETLKTLFFLLALSLSFGASAKNIVFWLSIDGLRGDYLDRAHTPNFDRMRSRALHGSKLVPIFPSLTFPSHTSQATGVKVAEHGISFNTFYDSQLGQVMSFPSEALYLQAEPIWNSVKRQGLRSAVWDWPLSHAQTGPDRADYFNMAYDGKLTDDERIERALSTWALDTETQRDPLDLIMAYIEGPDPAGHRFGPNDSRVLQVVENVDKLVGRIQRAIIEMAEKRFGKGHNYYLIITTDHGMTEVKWAVNIRLLSDLPPKTNIRTLTGGNVGHVFLDQLRPGERAAAIRRLKATYAKYPFVKAYEKRELPPEWDYGHPTRVGDLVLVLEADHSFNARAARVVVPVAEAGGPIGVHGFDPRSERDMKGFFMLWQYPEMRRGVEIDRPFHSLQLHPTVSHLLKVRPARKASAPVIEEVRRLVR
jgi:predicted AlkP superfamily pyrophosphatase or phosphodiesterase